MRPDKCDFLLLGIKNNFADERVSFMILKQKDVPVCGEYDVIVAGGGVAGVSAALAAVQTGAKTLLIETQYMLGGLATAGLITYYLPLCDGMGRQLSYGLAEKLLKLSISQGCEDHYPKEWIEENDLEKRTKKRYKTQFNANLFALLLEKELKNNGVEILYGTMVTDVLLNEQKNKINAVIIENRSGCAAVIGKSFVDATGDAVVCKYAEETTAIYKNGNTLAAWYYEFKDGKYRLREIGARDSDEAYETIGLYEGIEAKELSEVTVYAHQILLDRFLEKGKLDKTHAIATIATIPQVRMTRRICGKRTISCADERKSFKNSIGMFGNWRKKGPAYELPFECLCGTKIKNLLTAGRCVSVEDDLWDLTRVIPVCAITGEAAGVAAAMTDDVTSIDVEKLQNEICNRGGKIHLQDIGIYDYIKD